MPKVVYQLMELYPQAGGRRPSVQYVPVPYRAPGPEPVRGGRRRPLIFLQG